MNEKNPKLTRFHVGNMPNDLSLDLEFFNKQFSKYGEIVEKIEVHQKPHVNYSFGYVTLMITDSQIKKLKSQLNNCFFMGNKITFVEAKPHYKTLLQNELILNKSCEEIHSTLNNEKCISNFNNQILSFNLKKIECSSNKFKRHLLVKGVHRKKKRALDYFKSNNQIFRVLINGKLKILKSKKVKVWGYIDKDILELTNTFEDGIWKNAKGCILEKVSNNINVKKKINKFDCIHNTECKNSTVNFEIDKKTKSEANDQNFLNKDLKINFCEETIKNKDIIEIKKEEKLNSNSDINLLLENKNDPNDLIETKKKTYVDNLKRLFNNQDKPDFKDINNIEFKSFTKINELELNNSNDRKKKNTFSFVNEEDNKYKKSDHFLNNNKKELFWIHNDSFFLSSQSQINKFEIQNCFHDFPIELLNEKENDSLYVDWFWKMRSIFMKECKNNLRNFNKLFKLRKT